MQEPTVQNKSNGIDVLRTFGVKWYLYDISCVESEHEAFAVRPISIKEIDQSVNQPSH